MQVKGKRHPVAVYEALSPLAAEQLPDRRQLRARAPLDNFASPYDIMRGPSSLHGAPVDLQTPLIGADLMMTQVQSPQSCEARSLQSDHWWCDARRHIYRFPHTCFDMVC